MPCRVLIVEDDPDLRDMMAKMLELEGFDPDEARDGLEALDILHSTALPPHVILLDMMMPRMDGWSFVQRQAQDPQIAAIPIVIVSAAPADRLRHVPAAAILQKPLNFDHLLVTLRAHC